MRSLSGGELALLQSATGYNVYKRVWIANADGTWKDLSNLSGIDFVEDLEIDIDVDQPVAACTVRCKRDVGALSLAPFREDSLLNRRDDGVTYANLIDPGRDFYVETACVALGASPASGDWKEVFRGIIDSVNAASEPLTFTARDLGAYIADAWFAEATTDTWGPLGTPLETAIQQVLIEGGMDGRVTFVTLNTPVSPGFQVTSFGYDREPVLDAVIRLAQVIGWDVRYLWDEGSSSWLFTLRDPDRTKTTPDATFGPSQYIDITNLTIDRTNVRNSIIVKWGPATGRSAKLYEDGVSISRFKKRSIVIEEASDSPIDTEPEADALAAAVLSDLANPKADQSVEMLYFWPAELCDLYRFSPNNVHYSVNEDLAVVRIRHVLGKSGGANGGVQHRTTFDVRGKPSGGYLNWIARAAKGKTPTPDPNALEGLTMVVHQSDASDESVDLNVYVADSGPDPAKPIMVQARGSGVGSIVAEDGTQSAVLGSRGNLHGTAAADVTQWETASDVGATITAELDPTIAGPDGKKGRVWKIVTSGPAYLFRDAVAGNFSDVQVSARVWAKADAGSPTLENAAMTDGGVRLASGTATLTLNWQRLSCTGSFATTSGVLQHILYLPAGGTAYVWVPIIIRGEFADVTSDIETTDFVKIHVARADMTTTATNIVRDSDTFDAASWARGASVTVDPAVGTYAGHSFARVAQSDPATANVAQLLTGIDEDGLYTVSIWLRHDGSAGDDITQLYDDSATTSLASFRRDFMPDGSIQITQLSGQITVSEEADGVIRVDMVSASPLVATHDNVLYASNIGGGGLGAGGVASQLLSGAMVIKGSRPFPVPITTSTQPRTLTVPNVDGLVSLVAQRLDFAPATAPVPISPRGTLPASAAQFSVEGEATSRDGNGDGKVRLIARFDARIESVGVYAGKETDTAGTVPNSDVNTYLTTLTRHEGVIASDENWTTELDIPTTPGKYRPIVLALLQPGSSAKANQYRAALEQQLEGLAADVGTGPSAPPSAVTVTTTVIGGVPRNTVSFTAGDATSPHRVMRNGYWLTRLPAGVFSFVDDGLTAGTAYKYRIQAIKSGQTSEFDDGGDGGTSGDTGTSTAQTPSWATGYPHGGGLPSDPGNGNPAYVTIRVVNPDPLADTQVWMSPGNTDAGPWIGVGGGIPAGSTTLTINATDYGVAYGEMRWFYLIGSRPRWTDSPESVHKSAIFAADG